MGQPKYKQFNFNLEPVQRKPGIDFTSITSSSCTNILSPKNYKAKLKVEKTLEKHFCKKNLLLKCW